MSETQDKKPLSVQIQEWREAIEKDVTVNADAWGDDFAGISSRYFYWMNKLESLRFKQGRLNKIVAEYEATLATSFRNAGSKGGRTKPTVAEVETYITLDSRHQKLVDQVRMYDYAIGVVKAGCESIRMKKDALISIGANIRASF